MRRAVVLAVLLCLTVPARTGLAAEETAPEQEKIYHVSGTVLSVDEKELKIIEESVIPERIYDFVLTEETELPEGLKKGDKVAVTYHSKHRRKYFYTRTALSVELR